MVSLNDTQVADAFGVEFSTVWSTKLNAGTVKITRLPLCLALLGRVEATKRVARGPWASARHRAKNSHMRNERLEALWKYGRSKFESRSPKAPLAHIPH
jgi:hypothetical protein